MLYSLLISRPLIPITMDIPRAALCAFSAGVLSLPLVHEQENPGNEWQWIVQL